jgi:hypothetical protein
VVRKENKKEKISSKKRDIKDHANLGKPSKPYLITKTYNL